MKKKNKSRIKKNKILWIGFRILQPVLVLFFYWKFCIDKWFHSINGKYVFRIIFSISKLLTEVEAQLWMSMELYLVLLISQLYYFFQWNWNHKNKAFFFVFTFIIIHKSYVTLLRSIMLYDNIQTLKFTFNKLKTYQSLKLNDFQ